MYSSIENKLYADFYYNEMHNPISLRNRVVLMPNKNSYFNYFMGIRYLLTDVDNLPYGYQTVLQKGNYVIAENENVLPMCYGTDQLFPEIVYEDLAFPYNLEVLCSSAVIPGNGDAERGFMPHIKEETPELLGVDKVFASETGGLLSLDSAESHTLKLSKSLKKKILIISFQVESKSGREVIIEVNGMRNNLSAESAPYPNENHTFTYVLPAEENMEELELELSKGNYNISSLQIYTMDVQYLQHDGISLPSLAQEGERDGKTVFKGDIDMNKDGYFITSYPYRKGYQVFVDGKEVNYEKVNTAFVGFPLSKGNHQIEINYFAPGFKAGLAISILSLLILCFITFRERKKAL